MDARHGRRGRRLLGAEREANARRVLARWEASGLSQVAFCRSEGITTVTLARWRREFGDESKPPESPVRFVKVEVGGGAGSAVIEVDLASGHRLRVPPGFSAEDLERILAVLERPRC